MSSDLYEWLFTPDEFCLVHSKRSGTLDNLLFTALTSEFAERTFLIMDLENRIFDVPNRWFVFKINSLEKYLKVMISLHRYLSPRLGGIYVSGFPVFIGDYLSNVHLYESINVKMAAFILSRLQDLSRTVPVLVKSYSSGDLPTFTRATRYYVQNLISVSVTPESTTFIRGDESLSFP